VVEKPPAVKRPWWVRVTLLGLPSRASAMACVWCLLVLAIAVLNFGRRDIRLAWIVAPIALAGLGYALAIRWVDTHGGW
jgi:hypothetical protein